jgi:FkbM family methyltransferase
MPPKSLAKLGQGGSAMVSYAQNFEDVMLARAFAAQATGFYIDAGAFHPDIDSVTRHFYESGWHGINVEPVATQHALLVNARARDVNLNIALGCQSGEMTLYDFSPLGVSTVDPAVAAEMRARNLVDRRVKVQVRTLAEICLQYDVREVDFLKVDVEGHEGDVLAGLDWSRVRPRILVVEATRPMTQEPTFASWEPLVLRHGYLFAWFDGLNRFYVRREEAHLLENFKVPPNVFDNFTRPGPRLGRIARFVAKLEHRLLRE